jgi:lysozyme
MIIKHPACYDISHWKEVADFNAISPRPVLMITKATEGTNLIDGKFVRFFNGMKAAGYYRGAYHFFRKAVGANAQALFFCNFIEPHIDHATILILDVEEEGVEASMMWAWFEVVKRIYPYNLIMLYGRAEQLDRILMTTPEKEYFKRIPTWAAGYPFLPDNYTSIPAFYVPDQGKYGKPWLWQYSESGSVFGIQGAVDLNWISPELQKVLVTETLPTPEEPTGETMQGKVLKLTNIRALKTQFSSDMGDLLAGDIVQWSIEATGSDGLVWMTLTSATRNGVPVLCTDGNTVAGRYCWANNVEEIDPPVTPPPAEVHPVKATYEMSDGSVWIAETFTKVG